MKIETEKIVSYTKGIYSKKEEWIFTNEPGSFVVDGYHREDGPALIKYYKDGTIAEEGWYNEGFLSRPIEEGPAETLYYRNGNIKFMHWTTGEYGAQKKSIRYYEDGTIKEKYDSGTFEIYDSKYNIYMRDNYEFKYYKNGNIKSEKRGVNENCSLDKPIIAQYDINGNILNAKYFLYNVGYITQTQLNKYNKQLQSKTIKTRNSKTLEILYHLAKIYNYTDKIDQIGGLLVMNKLIN